MSGVATFRHTPLHDMIWGLHPVAGAAASVAVLVCIPLLRTCSFRPYAYPTHDVRVRVCMYVLVHRSGYDDRDRDYDDRDRDRDDRTREKEEQG